MEEETNNNRIEIGDIILASNTTSIRELINIAIILLKEPIVKEYLDLCKELRKINGNGYVG